MANGKKRVKLSNGGWRIDHADGLIQYTNDNGDIHRIDGPALINETADFWYRNGKLHREDGPAIEMTDRFFGHLDQWWLDGERMTRAEFDARRRPVQPSKPRVPKL